VQLLIARPFEELSRILYRVHQLLTVSPPAGLRNVVVCFPNLLLIAAIVAVVVAVIAAVVVSFVVASVVAVIVAVIIALVAAPRNSSCSLLLSELDDSLLFVSQHA
jgi:Flp pilus assembly protein TadB